MSPLNTADKIAQLNIFLSDIESLSFTKENVGVLYNLTLEIKVYSKAYVFDLVNNARLSHDSIASIYEKRVPKDEAKLIFNECKRNSERDLGMAIYHLTQSIG